jgi:3-hydroxyacyl-CoA dehydrogenase
VTHADGRETVEEIKDDMGLKAGDKSGMMARLRAQGVQSTAVNIFGGYEDMNKPTSHVPNSFKELVEQGRAGRSTAQVATNQSHGKKRSTNTKIFQSSVVIGDDGDGNSSHPRQNLKVRNIISLSSPSSPQTFFDLWKGGISRLHVESNLIGAAPSIEVSLKLISLID